MFSTIMLGFMTTGQVLVQVLRFRSKTRCILTISMEAETRVEGQVIVQALRFRFRTGCILAPFPWKQGRAWKDKF